LLYFTATPIGNLEDITYRAIRIMKETDYIICEDTRKTVILLNKYRIKKPMKPYNDYNKKKQAEWIIEQLKKGMDIVFVSSSGSPLISDPGFYLVKRLIQEGLPFTSLPGPSAVINSLSCEKRTVIIYESPKRIKRLINELEEFLPDREISIVKEMTKIHQRVLIGKPKELMENLHSEIGEFVVIIGGKDWTGIE